VADFNLQPDQERAVTFPVQTPGELTISMIYPVDVRVVSPSQAPREWTQNLSFIACRRRVEPITVDGKLDDWDLESLRPVEYLRTIYFNSRGRKEFSPLSERDQATYMWKGRDDLWCKLYTRWDDEYLYLAYDVQDDAWHNEGKDRAIWDGDTVMEDLLCGTIEPGKGLKLMAIRSHLGKNADGENIALRCDLGSPGLADPPGVQFVMKVDGTHQIYEIAYPFDTLHPLKAGLGSKFRLAGWLFDDDAPGRQAIRGLDLFSYVTNVDRNPEYWADWTMTE
jgi:hypothetical protein